MEKLIGRKAETKALLQYAKSGKGESLAQSIDRLFFSPEGMFRYEFDNLYKSLFTHSVGGY